MGEPLMRRGQENTGTSSDTGSAARRRYSTLRLLLLSGAATVVLLPAGAGASDLLDLGTLNGGTESVPFAVSADGTTVVGYATDGAANNAERAFRWTRTGGLVNLGTFNAGSQSYAYGLSADGTVVVGFANDGNANDEARAFRWTQAGGLVNLGTFNGGTESKAYGVSNDGSVVVGVAKDGNSNDAERAFRWTQASGLVNLGTLNGGLESTALGVSGDGAVVVGYADNGANMRAFRWTQATGMTNLGILNGDTDSVATATNSDGSVVVGFGTDAGNVNSAFRWTQGTGMVGLGTFNGGNGSTAKGVSADGSVVVGYADDGNVNHGFRWTQNGGMITVDQWLRDNGVTLASDVTSSAYGISADGNVIAGTLTNNHAFIARGPSATTSKAGLMDVTNFQQSLVNTPRVSGQLQDADIAVNGAHSSPLFMLLDAGQSSFWFTGDGGYASTKTANGGLGAGEFGFGRGLEDGWTVRLAGGGQYSRMDMPNGGNATFSSGYIAPDVSHVFAGGFVATLSGYLNWGKADIRRGYLNGTANDSSFGSAATQTFGVRARLDWQDAFKLGSTGVSPFASYTYLNAQMNGYTEAGGSFPVRFDGSREISNTVRIGADAKTPLNDQLALVTRFEYGHRFEKTGAGVSGQILGLSAFSIDGAAIQQDWVRGGLGVSYKLGNGDGLVMLNTSNQTGRNTTWLSASYRVKF
ncbi:autotransporter domain-containing protein [Rhizobium sp. C4]|uniref:autotransporter domain-containing protein n=1 Tax=Rhizobium sp. C4 TaxID=1349800 RepID=UPI001E31CDCF|nr:autotransporter domain-containing protein [Rhizobium sp. C4]MCD2173465.1 autotransporter domain-containing protein [Rhizobium sp. C4]